MLGNEGAEHWVKKTGGSDNSLLLPKFAPCKLRKQTAGARCLKNSWFNEKNSLCETSVPVKVFKSVQFENYRDKFFWRQ
ncbi:MAG: hypothetical protein A2252_00770 [Elusimicrobia bacterium RIFOXYA2_FULL_39_19]|nr:MAG: hypothetical protein A2252_00770 [Elusimicrobia bacterium RIFOXYA2_FULL_39_19]